MSWESFYKERFSSKEFSTYKDYNREFLARSRPLTSLGSTTFIDIKEALIYNILGFTPICGYQSHWQVFGINS